jgi:DnaJ-class molecular chaperone
MISLIILTIISLCICIFLLSLPPDNKKEIICPECHGYKAHSNFICIEWCETCSGKGYINKV